MRTLTVLFDGRCELCRFARGWLEGQPKHVAMVYVPAGSVQARMLFPTLDHEATQGELTVIADDGALWRGPKAWLTCLWALVSYRGLALSLAESGRYEAAKEAFEALSRNRHRLGGVVGLLRGAP